MTEADYGKWDRLGNGALRRSTGLRREARLLDEAREKRESPEEACRTGAGINSLVECLLWQYLNCGPQFLEKQLEPSEE